MIEPSHEGETHSVEAALQVFVNARSWDETCRVLEAQRDVLLSDAAMDVLRANVDERRAAGQEDAAAHLERHLRLLERARKEGIDAAFQALARDLDEDQGDEDGIPPELREILRRPESLTRLEDMPSRIALLEQALTLVQRASQPVLWAVLQGELGNALADRARLLIGQTRRTTLEAAITFYDAALLERRGRWRHSIGP